MSFGELCADEGRLVAEHIVTVQQLCIRWQCTIYSQGMWQKLNASLCVNEQRGIPCRPMVAVTVCRHIDDYQCAVTQHSKRAASAMGSAHIDLIGEKKMTRIEQIELERHRKQLTADVRDLVEKYRSIFEWDVPDIDEAVSDRLILAAIRQALDAVEESLSELKRR